MIDPNKPVSTEFNKLQKQRAKKLLKALNVEKTNTSDGSVTDDFGIPEPDREYILCIEAIWKNIWHIAINPKDKITKDKKKQCFISM